MFWTKFVELCEGQGLKPRKIAAEFDVAPATVTRWKHGSVPRAEAPPAPTAFSAAKRVSGAGPSRSCDTSVRAQERNKHKVVAERHSRRKTVS